MTLLAEKSETKREKLTKEDLKKMRDEDMKMVRGIFRCFEPRGGQFTFSYKKYKQDPVMSFTMIDGEIYTVPKMVAKHLNNNCSYPVHQHTQDANGNPLTIIGKKVKRCSFESLEFSNIEE